MYKPKSRLNYALVAEQVDAADLKSVVRKDVPVRFRPSAPTKKDVFWQTHPFLLNFNCRIKSNLCTGANFPTNFSSLLIAIIQMQQAYSQHNIIISARS